MDIKLHYDDVSIVPETLTDINSRSLCNPYDEYGMLPIFASPMSSVVSEHNYKEFIDNKITPVIPRSVGLITRLNILLNTMEIKNPYALQKTPFVAFSMKEAKQIFADGDLEDGYEFVLYDKITTNLKDNVGYDVRICIDLANGHMKDLLKIVKAIKDKWGTRMKVMTGNIANPKSYKEYEKVGCDYVRVSIGTGSGCLTASNTGVYYPPFSLLKEISEIKKKIDGKCKVIADGGIKGYRDIQKALIYADYVMIGGVFNKAIESAGQTTYGKSYINVFGKKVRNYLVDAFRVGKTVPKCKYDKVMSAVKIGKLEVNKLFYGMSTKIAQGETGAGTNKTSEGMIKTNNVEYSLKQWVENEESYLRSAMSYTNSFTLEDYKESQWVQINGITHNR